MTRILVALACLAMSAPALAKDAEAGKAKAAQVCAACHGPDGNKPSAPDQPILAGMVLWRPGELTEEVRRGLWYLVDPKADLVLRKQTDNLWEELVARSERKANAI
jgi:mono/diheme cytochrome c family protein